MLGREAKKAEKLEKKEEAKARSLFLHIHMYVYTCLPTYTILPYQNTHGYKGGGHSFHFIRRLLRTAPTTRARCKRLSVCAHARVACSPLTRVYTRGTPVRSLIHITCTHCMRTGRTQGGRQHRAGRQRGYERRERLRCAVFQQVR